MAKSIGKVKLRRSQVRRQKSEQSEPLLKRLRERIGLAPPAVGLGFFVLATVIVLYRQDPFPYYDGQEMRGPIWARVEFDIIDEKETQLSQQKGREQTSNYYKLNEGLIERIGGAIGNLYADAQQFESFEGYQQAKTSQGDKAAKTDSAVLDERGYQELRALADEQGQSQFQGWIARLTDQLKRERLVKTGDDEKRELPLWSANAVLKGALPHDNDTTLAETGDVVILRTGLEYFGESTLKYVERSAESLSRVYPPELSETIRAILVSALSEEPLFQFDLERTREAMEAEAASRKEVKDPFKPNMLLADSEQETDANAEAQQATPRMLYRLASPQIDKLRHEHDKFTELLTAPIESLAAEEKNIAQVLRKQRRFEEVGLGAVVFLITLGLIAYCSLFQPRVIENPIRALSLAILFLIMMALSRAIYTAELSVLYPFVVVGPVVMTAAILTMVYSQRFALGMTAGLAVLITFTVRGDLGMLLVLTASMAVAVYQLREIRSRHELFSTGLLNALSAFIATMVVIMVAGYSLETSIEQGASAAVSALLAIAFFFMMLPPIERIFKVATNWTLLELLDTSRPLLSRLAREAPGTFTHSLWLSSMAENACESIGANALLAKVGAMYHDIGKVHKAEYFAENQEAQINRHDNLSPTMSLLVIVGHVKDGAELAREERLPSTIIRFIEEHHGTTVVRYFHHVASEQQKAAGNAREVSEAEFRYPGPKPQSRETAVVMLCDGVEGAVRALQEPTAGRIENVVHEVIMDRLNDGQFDACDITLKELHQVEESLVKSLCRFYHGRVAYPKAPAPQKTADTVPMMG